MRRKSHYQLGLYLTYIYMSNAESHYKQAFLFGCMEPDWNPASYLKGSLRYHLLRGHNYSNAKKYIEKLLSQLGRKQEISILDCYRTGKLIHYVLDAFTYVHNDIASQKLTNHRRYEILLQERFLSFLSSAPMCAYLHPPDLTSFLDERHIHYLQLSPEYHNDSCFAITVSSVIASSILTKVKPARRNLPSGFCSCFTDIPVSQPLRRYAE